MFSHIVGFELRQGLRRISTWLYFGIFFALGFLLINVAGGAFRGMAAGTGGKEFVNSPVAIAAWTALLSVFGVIVTAAVVGSSAHRDFATSMHPLFFTSPVRKRDYLGGRFTGAILVNLIIFVGVPLGIMLGSVMPYLERTRFGPFRLDAYIQPFLAFTLPNLLLTGAIFFALAALTRQMLSNYVGGVVLLVGYLLSSSLLRDIENKRLAALVDPFGLRAVSLDTRYWSVAERNSQLVPLSDGLLASNRLLWLGGAALVFGVVYVRFRFAHLGPELRRRTRAISSIPSAPAVPARLTVPAATRTFGGRAWWTQFLSTTQREFWGIVRNVYFAALVLAGLAFIVFSATQLGRIYGTNTYPVTYQVLELLGGTFALFLLIIITFYAGELVWRERELRANQIYDSLPVSTWVPFLGKLAALVLVVMVVLSLLLVCGIITQAAKGYFRFELTQYIQELFGIQLVDYVLLCVLALSVHTLVNHKYVGHLIVVLFFVFTGFMGQLGLEHNLYKYGSDGGVVYSDMNRYGHFLGPWSWWKLYWAAFAVLLAVATNLFWVRGRETAARRRLTLASARFGQPAKGVAAVAAAAFMALGGWIFYNTNVLNEYRTTKQQEAAIAQYEERYKRHEHTPQPRITAVDLNVDIFPKWRDVLARGTYRLRNKTGVPIDSVHLQIPREVEVRRLVFDRAHRKVLEDEERGYRIFALNEPLQPGDSLTLTFSLAYVSRGFENETGGTQIVHNGTFFNNALLPSVGYNAQQELQDDDTRKRYGLKPKPRMAAVDDLRARRNTYISNDADWIDFRATVSTSPDQIAIAPGYLKRAWTQNGRRYFEYAMDAPILNFYAFLSARYAVKRDRWKNVAIEVYFHPEHEYNVDRMLSATKKSLDYYTANFGPYQHRQVRILEFPRYAMFAQSFPNTIPYSESIGFIARVEEGPDAIDYPFYVTAHEVAHQWFAHQVIGGNVQGSTMLSETLSQYAALMVMEKEFGRANMKRFLKYELDDYLSGRAFEQKKEQPLMLVENQQYIHYNKGSLAMYALRDLIGEDRLNDALARYIQAVKFQQPPYTNSVEFLKYIRAATPDSLRYALTDLFETITLYDNRTRTATVTPLANGRYAVDLEVQTKKMRADSLGVETPVAMNDLVDIGVFAPARKGEKEGRPLYLQKHRIGSGTQRVRIEVPEKPARAGIDPLHKLIDRVTDDNVISVR